MLQEQGLAQKIANGFHIPTESACALDDELADTLGLPPVYAGSFRTIISSHTSSSAFSVQLVAEIDGTPAQVTRTGPLLHIGGHGHRASVSQLHALDAVDAHAALRPDARTELANASVIAALQDAVSAGLNADLSHFSRGGWTTERVDKITVTGTVSDDGDLVLTPALGVDAAPDAIAGRWGQLPRSGRRGGVMRIGKKLILLDGQALDAAHEVLEHRVVKREDVQTFLRTPSAFLDAALIDFDLGFSVRVAGIGRLTHIDFGEMPSGGLDWFASGTALPPAALHRLVKSADDLGRFTDGYDAARAQHADTLCFEGEIIDIRDPEAVGRAVAEIGAGLSSSAPPVDAVPDSAAAEREQATEKVGFLLKEAKQVVDDLHRSATDAAAQATIDMSAVARDPFDHQRTGIQWMLGMMRRARHSSPDDLYRLQGALLADDMGLGKTFMSLVAIQNLNAATSREEGPLHVKPTLVVAPLSLLENWEDEVAKTFTESPFSDIVVLQSQRDLRRFRVAGAGREVFQATSSIDEAGLMRDGELRIALKVGPAAGTGRLDTPGRLVLTTYETLRDYQFSLSQVEWGVVVFDEAQKIKNPAAAVTRAAKALKAEFKLAATGTPVENSLMEFWCLIDTAQPGLLGDWHAFRDTYVLPAQHAVGEDADRRRAELGVQLRQAVGPFMLRRVKEDHLPGLPAKIVHIGIPDTAGEHETYDPRLGRTMPAVQRSAYEAHLSEFRDARFTAQPVHPLTVLTELRLTSLHPQLGVHGERPALPSSADDAAAQVAMSAKLIALMDVLEDIRAREEKAIVFAQSKDLQVLLALWLRLRFGLRPDIINGDTKAVSGAGAASRREIIAGFEARPGFNVIVMSPIAAGVGLTIVGANHVIHLERHWNPAKEAQATDRAYRIGQTRDVHVYHPAALHPRFESFDVLIDKLLRHKVTVKDAVMTQPAVTDAEMASLITAE